MRNSKEIPGEGGVKDSGSSLIVCTVLSISVFSCVSLVLKMVSLNLNYIISFSVK